MAAGEYVSVSSQADTERADLERERRELHEERPKELVELAGIYESRGLSPELARQVAHQLMEHDALGAHARDELGITEASEARPIQAALSSASTFAVGAGLPLAVAAVVPLSSTIWSVGGASLLCLALLGAASAWAGSADVRKATLRVTFWGALAMALTAGVGRLFGAVV